MPLKKKRGFVRLLPLRAGTSIAAVAEDSADDVAENSETGRTVRGVYELVGQGAGDETLDAEVLHEIVSRGEGASPDDLRKTADELPWSTFLVAIVELCERFAYYGLSGPFQNYISNSYNDPNGLPGALGLHQTVATAMTNGFQLWCYVTPIIGAVVADQYLGKYWTIYFSAVIYAVGILILFLTSLPVAITHGFSFGGLVAAMIVIGLGTGGIKSNVSPLIAEQYQNTRPFRRVLKTGEQVIIDPELTVQRIYMVYYLCINVGSSLAFVTTTLEASVGFWSAYSLCLVVFLIGFIMFVRGRSEYIMQPPQGSVIPQAMRVCWIALRKWNLNAARPEVSVNKLPWNSTFVDEVQRALKACRVFLFFPIYWLVYSQMLNNFISQAGQMQLHGIPNDLLQNIDPFTVIIFIPICDRLLYPFLRRIGIEFPPMTRIFMGFIFGAVSMLYAAIVQHQIYISGPCYSAPRACEAAAQSPIDQDPSAGTKYAPNDVNVFIQTPAYLILGLSEIFAAVTGFEVAYSEAPDGMKSFVMSLFLFTNAIGSMLGALLSPIAVDPKLTFLYSGLSLACLLSGVLFWFQFCRRPTGKEGLQRNTPIVGTVDAAQVEAGLGSFELELASPVESGEESFGESDAKGEEAKQTGESEGEEERDLGDAAWE